MKLLSSNASPYGRKVRACAIALGLERQITVVDTSTAEPEPAFLAANPLGRIPTLVTEDGFALFDSRVICEYLNDYAGAIPMIPSPGAQRWRCLRLQALGDGMMDAAVGRRQFQVGGVADDHPLSARHARAVSRALDLLERETPGLHIDLGVLSVACALGYLDLRFADEPWREGHPALARWFEAVSAHRCLSETAP